MSQRKTQLLYGILWIALCAGTAWSDDVKLDAQELVARHLESIGNTDTLAAHGSTIARGKARVTLIIGGAGYMDGPAAFGTDRDRMSLILDFQRPEYLHEHLVFDGEDSNTAFMRPGFRSPLAEFLFTYTEIMEEGLFGSALSARWALLRVEETKARLRYRGLKEFEDRKLHQLDYQMRRRGRDLQIRLYFNPFSYRHEATTYDVSISPNLGSTPGLSSRLRTTRLRLVERFGNFKTVGDLNVPTLWELEFSQEGTLQGVLWKWLMEYEHVEHNVTLDDASFTVSY